MSSRLYPRCDGLDKVKSIVTKRSAFAVALCIKTQRRDTHSPRELREEQQQLPFWGLSRRPAMGALWLHSKTRSFTSQGRKS